MYSVQGLNAQKKLQMQLPSVKIWTKSTISSDYSSLMCMFKKRATLVWEAEAVKICLSNHYTLKTLKVFKLSHKSMLHQPPPPLPKPPPPPPAQTTPSPNPKALKLPQPLYPFLPFIEKKMCGSSVLCMYVWTLSLPGKFIGGLTQKEKK